MGRWRCRLFNQTGFNAVPFNRPVITELYFAATLSGDGTLYASPSVTFIVGATITGEGSLSADFVREIARAAALSADGALSASVARERISAAILAGDGSLTARPRKYHVKSLSVDGPFGPGDKITIDSGRLIVLKNGEYIGYDGDFFDLHPGDNTITYTDAAGSRTVQIRVTWRDRYL